MVMVQLMPLHPKTPSSLASVKSRLVLPFWYRLTRVVPEKGPLNGCRKVKRDGAGNTTENSITFSVTQEEGLLSQTDCARRRVSRILANCCITVKVQLVRRVQNKIEVMELEAYSRPTYNKLVHSATTHFTVVGVIHKLTVDVNNTCTPTTCCGKIF